MNIFVRIIIAVVAAVGVVGVSAFYFNSDAYVPNSANDWAVNTNAGEAALDANNELWPLDMALYNHLVEGDIEAAQATYDEMVVLVDAMHTATEELGEGDFPTQWRAYMDSVDNYMAAVAELIDATATGDAVSIDAAWEKAEDAGWSVIDLQEGLGFDESPVED